MDDDLRAHERRARERPDDLAAGLAHARALERAGQRRPFFLELARLARAGSADAIDRLERWSLVHPGTARASRDGPRGAPRVRASDVACPRELRAIGATGGALVVRAGDEGLAIELATGAVRWQSRLPKASLAALRGDDVVVAHGRGLALLDGATGKTVARAPRAGGRPRQLLVDRDRAVLVFAEGVVAVDAGTALGAELWKAEGAFFTATASTGVFHAASRRVPTDAELGEVARALDDFLGAWERGGPGAMPRELEARGRELQAERLEARRLDDGAVAWSAAADPGVIHLVAADGRGLLLQPAPRLASLAEVDARAGAHRWGPVETSLVWTEHALGEDAVVVVGRDGNLDVPSGGTLRAIDRATGTLRWARPTSGGPFGLVVGPTAAFLAAGPELRVSAHDLADGRELWAHDLGDTVDAEQALLALVPLDGALVLVAETRAGARLFRFE